MTRKAVLQSVLAMVALAAFAAPEARALNLNDADARELRAYTLTESTFDRYAEATRNLSGVQIQSCDDESAVASIDEAAARLDAVPAARSAVHRAGLTSREYVVFALSLLQSGLAANALAQLDADLPPGVPLENLDFYLEHAGEMQQLSDESLGPACPGCRARRLSPTRAAGPSTP